ncbi:tRNA dihydrouridine synthase DusB [Parvularcula lutaonensis]|uniref:tRNA-dihydrouridine synthase n=1 Tax=Parvularcula lutaonensis TaxID=491923 RepID=A0ABV7MEU5_9PROT|nr:tRNA dihydrouridine synthase DusB [Parvularcula lutaonensis]GGY52638.1 tRNA-dihydrouridine synthase [Parvularcula lutaonensis]
MLQIGPHTVDTRVLLAPMSGISDLPFRQAAQAAGCPYVVTEMVASEELTRERPDVVLRAAMDDSEHLKVMQLAGREARWMAEGAKVAEAMGAEIIDINMGCPARKVTGLLSGSALMRDLDHAESLIRATVDAVSVPVTLKMRLGWDWQSLNAPELAQRAEAAGVKLLTVHGRTRCDFYKGTANWRAVREVKEATSLPLVVNGDIETVEHAREAMAQSGADAVMVGRAATGRPWLPAAMDTALRDGSEMVPPSFEERGRMAIEQYEKTVTLYREGHGQSPELGEALGVRMARKHLAALVDVTPEFPDEAKSRAKANLCSETDPAKVRAILERLFGPARDKAAA